MVLKELGIGVPHITSVNGKADSKGLILGTLSKEWPLAAKEIFYRIRQNTGDIITYQGVHKAIMQLTQEEVLSKNQSKYSISPEWISKLNKFGSELQRAFLGKRCVHLNEIPRNTSAQLVFDSLIDYFYWLLDELNSEMKDGSIDSTHSIAYHPWPIFNISKSQYGGLKNAYSASEHYFAFKGNSALDKALVSIWKNIGVKVKLKAECSKNCDILVYRDYVIQLFISNSTKKELSKLFDGAKNINGKLLSDYYELIYEHSEPVNVLVARNPELAGQIREEVQIEFR
jgi:hypothetical protein